MPPPLPLFCFSLFFPFIDIPTSFLSCLSVYHEKFSRWRCTVQSEYHNGRLPGISMPCIASPALTINQSLHIDDSLEVARSYDRPLISFLFYFLSRWGGVDTCYTCFCFLYPFLVPFSANLFWRYLHSLFFLFIHSHLHLESLFSSHPILRYTPSRFLCSLEILEILVTGIGIGPRKRGQVDDTYARVWEISVIEPGAGLGGGFVRFLFYCFKNLLPWYNDK